MCLELLLVGCNFSSINILIKFKPKKILKHSFKKNSIIYTTNELSLRNKQKNHFFLKLLIKLCENVVAIFLNHQDYDLSKFITLVQTSTKSFTNFSFESLQA
jgi:hypothetical protein